MTAAPTPRESFDEVAELYDEARPGYPAALFDELLALAALPQAAHLFEIGCGTGHATLEFARRGFSIDCIELGQNLAAVARGNLAQFAAVTIAVSDFDAYQAHAHYDLVYSASAYHWLNPATRIARAAALLRPAASIAVWRNHHIRGKRSERFNALVREVYASCAPQLAQKRAGPSDLASIPFTESEQWLASGLFRDAQTRVYLWQRRFTAEELMRLLATYSDHRMLAEETRARLFAALTSLIHSRFNGAVTREFATILQFARKR